VFWIDQLRRRRRKLLNASMHCRDRCSLIGSHHSRPGKVTRMSCGPQLSGEADCGTSCDGSLQVKARHSTTKLFSFTHIGWPTLTTSVAPGCLAQLVDPHVTLLDILRTQFEDASAVCHRRAFLAVFLEQALLKLKHVSRLAWGDVEPFARRARGVDLAAVTTEQSIVLMSITIPHTSLTTTPTQ
jgi:hypothetical protein